MVWELPGHVVEPLAVHSRCLLRLEAELLGVARTSIEPIQPVDYRGSSTVDTDDRVAAAGSVAEFEFERVVDGDVVLVAQVQSIA